MKKLTVILLSLMIVAGLASCGGSDKKDEEKNQTQTEQTDEKAKVDELKGDHSDTEAGVFYVKTAEGTSEDGNVPVLHVSKDTELTQIEVVATDMVGQTQYLYVDKKKVDEQEGDFQAVIDLKGDALKPGVHTVNAVVYKDNDPDKEIVSFKTAKFEVKEKE